MALVMINKETRAFTVELPDGKTFDFIRNAQHKLGENDVEEDEDTYRGTFGGGQSVIIIRFERDESGKLVFDEDGKKIVQGHYC